MRTLEDASKGDLQIVKLSDIIVHDRQRKDLGDLESLKDSITANGLIQPLAVYVVDDKMYLLAGGRRHKALSDLGKKEVAVRIYSEDLDVREVKILELHENTHRKDLTWQEKASSIAKLHKLHLEIKGEKAYTTDEEGWSARDTARSLGVSHTRVNEWLRLAKAVEHVPDMQKLDKKADALKLIKKVIKSAETSALLAEVQTEMSGKSEDKAKLDIIKGYMVIDCITGMESIPDGTVDIIEMDPPYGINLAETKKADGVHIQAASYNEVAVEDYAPFITNVLTECRRVLAPDGWMIVWFGADPWYHFMFSTLQKLNLRVYGVPNIWIKPSGQTISPKTRLANCYETFFAASKNGTIQKQGRRNIFEYKPVVTGNKIHPTERPVEMIQDILMTFSKPGAMVMVPFLGSGNTLLAASNANMKGYGFDLSKEYQPGFELRVRQGEVGKFKSYTKEEKE